VPLKLHYIVLLLCIYSYASSQDRVQSGKIKITGIIYDAQTSERVPFAHIIDVKRMKGTSADDRGNFSFHSNLYDSIKFTAIGYEDYYLLINDSIEAGSFLTIQLTPKSYLLESLDFYASDPMEGFYLKDIERDTIRIGGSKGNPGAGYWNGAPSGGSGYISAFANLFNKRHKQEKKLNKIMSAEQRYNLEKEAEEIRKKTLEEKYNDDLVRHYFV
jgi:hypothetical protein